MSTKSWDLYLLKVTVLVNFLVKRSTSLPVVTKFYKINKCDLCHGILGCLECILCLGLYVYVSSEVCLFLRQLLIVKILLSFSYLICNMLAKAAPAKQ